MIFETYLNSKNNKNTCIFCFPARGMILKGMGDLVVLADTFPLKVGHLILTSRKHFGCLGELPQKHLSEIDLFLMKLKQSNISYSLYEHGKAGSCHASGKGIFCEHFHLHILLDDKGVSDKIDSIVNDSFSNKILTSDSHHIANLYLEKGEYLLVGNENHQSMYPVANSYVPSHYLRTLFSNAYGVSHRSDWKNMDDFGLFKANYVYCTARLENMYGTKISKLSNRIKKIDHKKKLG